MRPRKTLQLRFDKQFQSSDEISLKRGRCKRVVLCKHEKSGGRSQVLTWSQNHLAVNIVIVTFNGLLTIVSGHQSVTAAEIRSQRSEFTTLVSQNLSLHGRDTGTFKWEAAWQGVTLTGRRMTHMLTGHSAVIMVTAVTPSLSSDIDTMCPLRLITDICVALHTVITQAKVSRRPQVGLGEDRGVTPGSMCPPQGRAGHWLTVVSVSRCAVMFAARSPGLLASPPCATLGCCWAGLATQAARTPGPLAPSRSLSSPDWLYIRARLGGIETTISKRSINSEIIKGFGLLLVTRISHVLPPE